MLENLAFSVAFWILTIKGSANKNDDLPCLVLPWQHDCYL